LGRQCRISLQFLIRHNIRDIQRDGGRKLGNVGQTQYKALAANDLVVGDLTSALIAGWQDYCAHPKYGLFFATFYVTAGFALYYVSLAWGQIAWLVPIAAGFPIFAPFAAVGLYEVSRRRELNLPLSWGVVLGALKGHGDEQILSMGVIVFVAFGFWIMVAHGIFAIFLADYEIGFASYRFLLTDAGIAMLLVGGVFGALMAYGFYAITVISLPMLVDQEIDFLTAIITSLSALRENKMVFLVWAVVIALLLAIAMIPLFLGLFVVLPILAHATWHLYRRTIRHLPA
jgi:uncharacterized membrane protein